jgi:hypothetical protein
VYSRLHILIGLLIYLAIYCYHHDLCVAFGNTWTLVQWVEKEFFVPERTTSWNFCNILSVVNALHGSHVPDTCAYGDSGLVKEVERYS